MPMNGARGGRMPPLYVCEIAPEMKFFFLKKKEEKFSYLLIRRKNCLDSSLKCD